MNARDDQPGTGDGRNRTAAFAADSALTAKGSATGFGDANAPQLAEQRQERTDATDAAKRLRDLGKQALLDARPNDGQLGEFTLVREIGRGGMGVVYEAIQQSLQRRVALKVLPLGSLMNRHQIHRFQNESRAAAQLHHPNIVPVFSVGSDAGIHYYAMQYIEGNNLARVIAEIRRDVAQSSVHAGRGVSPAGTTETTTEEPTQDEPQKLRKKQRPVESESSDSKRSGLSADDYIRARSSRRTPQVSAFFQAVARIGIQAAEALGHAHELSIVHRDVKPSNLMLDPNGKLWVTDFGLAQVRNAASMTKTGDLVGTLRYMSPEQASGRRSFLDHRTDIYSLGATLYELLTLRPVVPGKEFEEIFRQISFGRPAPLRRVNPRIPEELETIIGKTLERDPSDRYQTAAELAEDLRRFAADEPILARPPTMLKRYRRWMLRHRAVSAGVAAALAVILVVSLGASAVAWNALQLEKEQRQLAEAARDESDGSRLLTQAALVQTRDPGSALAFGVHGAELNPGPEANAALMAAMDANHELAAVTPRQHYSSSLAVSPEGSWVITCASTSQYAKGSWPAIVHDVPTGKTLAQLDSGAAITSAAFDPTGRTVLTTSAPTAPLRGQLDPDKRISEPPVLWDTQQWEMRFTFREATLPKAHESVFSPDGSKLVLCGPGATATVFDVATGLPLVSLRDHDARVIFAGFSPDGRWIATATEEGSVGVYSVDGGEQQWSFAIRDGAPWDAEIAFASNSAQLVITDRSGTRFLPLSKTDEAPTSRFYFARTASVSRSGPHAVLASGRQLAIVDTRSLDIVGAIELEESAQTVDRIQLRPDGRQLLVACERVLYLYAIPSGQRLATLAGHSGRVLDCGFASSEDYLVSVAVDKTLRIWHARSGLERRRLPDPLSSSSPTLLAFSSNGQLLATASSESWFAIGRRLDGQPSAERWPGRINRNYIEPQRLITWDHETVYVWDTASGRRLATLSRAGQPIRKAMAIPLTPWVAYITDQGAAALWHTVSDRIIPVTSPTDSALDIGAAAQGRRFAAALTSGNCRVFDLSGEPTAIDLLHDYRVVEVGFSDDGGKLLTVDNGNTIRIWADEETTPVVTIAVPKRNESGVARFVSGGRYVVSYDQFDNQLVRCWDAATGELLHERSATGSASVAAHSTEPIVSVSSAEGLQVWNLETDDVRVLTKDRVRAVRFIDDVVAAISLAPQVRSGQVLPFPNPEGASELRLWRIADGELIREDALEYEARDLTVLPSAQRLIIGVRSHNATVYRTDTHQRVLRVGDHRAAITFVGFGKDDATVVTASADGTAKIHDQQGRLLSTLTAGSQPITAAAISPDRQLLVTGDQAGGLVLWDLDQGAEVRRFEAHSDAVRSTAFDAHGHRLLTTSFDSTVRLWDLRTQRVRNFPVEHGVFAAELGADNQTLLIVPGDDQIRSEDGERGTRAAYGLRKTEGVTDALLINLNTDEQTALDQEGITILARFSPDGRRLGLLANNQGEFYVDVFEFPSLRRVHRLTPASSGPVTAFGFDDDASHLVTRQSTGLTLWDLSTGQQELDAPQRLVRTWTPWQARHWDAFSPDGAWIYTPHDADDRVTRWPVDVLGKARQLVPRPFTDQQRRQFRLRDAEPIEDIRGKL